MSGSVRFRFVRWLEGLGNRVSKNLVNYLRCSQTHPEARANDDFGCVLCVHNRLPKAQVNDAVNAAGLYGNINELGGSSVVYDNVGFVSDLDALGRTASYLDHGRLSDLIVSQNHPSLRDLNAKIMSGLCTTVQQQPTSSSITGWYQTSNPDLSGFRDLTQEEPE